MNIYYHVILETKEKNAKGKHECVYWYDCESLDELNEDVIEPYVRKGELYISGRYIDFDDIHLLIVKSSRKPIDTLVNEAQSRVPPNVFYFPSEQSVVRGVTDLEDVTKDLVKSKRNEIKDDLISTVVNKSDSDEINKKVFIVHGHDELAKSEMARFLEKAGLVAIILHEQVSSGMTIIEKIESFGDVGFAVILYTPCDFGGANVADSEPQPRARQNVVFEHGYFLGRLGRSKVSAFKKGDIETPNDISGVLYTPLDDSGAWKMSLLKELKAAGYSVNSDALL